MKKIFIALILIAAVGATVFYSTQNTSAPMSHEDDFELLTQAGFTKLFKVEQFISKKDQDENKKYLEGFFSTDNNSNKELQSLASSDFWACIKNTRKKFFVDGLLYFKGRRINKESMRASLVTLWKDEDSYNKYYKTCESEAFLKSLKDSPFVSEFDNKALSRQEALDLMKSFFDPSTNSVVDRVGTINNNKSSESEESSSPEEQPNDTK
ncbi:MAG: hypothetical protein HRT44_04315 [Bdellovibrionales bacterium]|nr:hypothetical protein [Bdellovibrionales bacterium]NQZ18468.1 hypothetical protein [Bdellovibrionales bacterium]